MGKIIRNGIEYGDVSASCISFTPGGGLLSDNVQDAIEEINNKFSNVVSKSSNGLCPQLPNETTTTKYLRQDGTWVVPPNDNTTYSAGSNITLSGTTFSLTKANVTGALGYTPPTTNTTYSAGSNITLSGTTFSLTKANVTGALGYTPPTTNTTYSAGSGLSLSGTTFSVSNGLLHTDYSSAIANTTTDSGWSMINSSYNGYLLKSIRFQGSSPAWGVGNYGAGICFGGADTKGIVSVGYGAPNIKIAGGNGTKPVWWIGLQGTSGATYNLANCVSGLTVVSNSWTYTIGANATMALHNMGTPTPSGYTMLGIVGLDTGNASVVAAMFKKRDNSNVDIDIKNTYNGSITATITWWCLCYKSG